MKSADKFLIGIVVGIVLLVIVAFVVVLVRPEPTYQPEDTPGGVVYNYLLALQKEEYERAYGYLSPGLDGYPPTEKAFIEDVRDSWRFQQISEVGFRVESEDVRDDWATVTVDEARFYGGTLFNSGQSYSTFEMELVLEAGEWKIVDGHRYFSRCWREADGCD